MALLGDSGPQGGSRWASVSVYVHACGGVEAGGLCSMQTLRDPGWLPCYI